MFGANQRCLSGERKDSKSTDRKSQQFRQKNLSGSSIYSSSVFRPLRSSHCCRIRIFFFHDSILVCLVGLARERPSQAASPSIAALGFDNPSLTGASNRSSFTCSLPLLPLCSLPPYSLLLHLWASFMTGEASSRPASSSAPSLPCPYHSSTYSGCLASSREQRQCLSRYG